MLSPALQGIKTWQRSARGCGCRRRMLSPALQGIKTRRPRKRPPNPTAGECFPPLCRGLRQRQTALDLADHGRMLSPALQGIKTGAASTSLTRPAGECFPPLCRGLRRGAVVQHVDVEGRMLSPLCRELRRKAHGLISISQRDECFPDALSLGFSMAATMHRHQRERRRNRRCSRAQHASMGEAGTLRRSGLLQLGQRAGTSKPRRTSESG